jgi:phage baseplate assembly protein W
MKFVQANFALDIHKKPLSIVECQDKKAIAQSIESIIMTQKGERVYQPKFGSFLNAEMFKKLTPNNAESVLYRLIDLIKMWEKRITILENDCSMNIDNSTSTLYLNIVYVINVIGEVDSFNKKIVF